MSKIEYERVICTSNIQINEHLNYFFIIQLLSITFDISLNGFLIFKSLSMLCVNVVKMWSFKKKMHGLYVICTLFMT